MSVIIILVCVTSHIFKWSPTILTRSATHSVTGVLCYFHSLPSHCSAWYEGNMRNSWLLIWYMLWCIWVCQAPVCLLTVCLCVYKCVFVAHPNLSCSEFGSILLYSDSCKYFISDHRIQRYAKSMYNLHVVLHCYLGHRTLATGMSGHLLDTLFDIISK